MNTLFLLSFSDATHKNYQIFGDVTELIEFTKNPIYDYNGYLVLETEHTVESFPDDFSEDLLYAKEGEVVDGNLVFMRVKL